MRRHARLLACILLVPCTTFGQLSHEGWRPWAFSVGVRERFDSNRDGSSSNEQVLVETIVRPRLDLRTMIGGTDINFFYGPSLKYRDNPRADQHRTDLYHDLGLTVRSEPAPRLTVDLSESFRLTDDPDIMAEGRTFRENASYISQQFSASCGYEVLPGRARVTVDAAYDTKDYEHDWYSTMGDQEEISIGLEGGYVTRFRTVVLGVISLIDTEMGKEGVDVQRDTEVLFIGGGLQHDFGKLNVRARTGWECTAYSRAQWSHRTRPAGDLHLVWAPAERTELDLAVQYHVTRGDIFPYSSQERTGVSLTTKHQFGQRLGGSIGLVYAKGEYSTQTWDMEGMAAEVDAVAAYFNTTPEVVLAILNDYLAQEYGGTDRLLALGATLNYEVNRNLDLEAGLTVEDWDGDWAIREDHQRSIFTMAVRGRF